WRRKDPCRSNHSICSASNSQPRATSSNALFMDGELVCAARFLASAALCRYSSDRDEHARRTLEGRFGSSDSPNHAQAHCVDQLAMTGRPSVMASPGPSHLTLGGPGRFLDPALADLGGVERVLRRPVPAAVARFWGITLSGTTRCPSSCVRVVPSPGPPCASRLGGSGCSLTAATERPMAFKWTK